MMAKFFATVLSVVLVSTLVSSERETLEQMAARVSKENSSARYSFFSDLDDMINGLTQHREEVRDGLKVTGSYSYSDGFFKRTVSYEADELGYRIVGEKVEALSTGPVTDPAGQATVHTQYQDGSLLHYRIQQVPEKK